MLPFGHIGAATCIVKLSHKLPGPKKDKNNVDDIDYRIVMVGAMLPDIIDKIISLVFYGKLGSHGRTLAHSLFFSLLLIIIGFFYLPKRSRNNIILIGICAFIHQVLDRTWTSPEILLWPLFEHKAVVAAFSKHVGTSSKVINSAALEDTIQLAHGIKNYFLTPYVFVSEIFGFLFLTYIFYKLFKQSRLKEFIKYGRL